MGKEEEHPLNDGGGEWEFPADKALGPLLRARREEMGLTYAEISEKIKVRPGHLEALENEDWERLPAPAFVKGFIRSYAKLLGLSEEGLEDLYQEISRPGGIPVLKTLQALPEKKRGYLYIILVLAVLAGGLALYFWIERPALRSPTPKEVAPQEDFTLSSEEQTDVAAPGPDAASTTAEADQRESNREPSSAQTEEKPFRENSVQRENGGALDAVEPPAEPLPQVPERTPSPVDEGPSEEKISAPDETAVSGDPADPGTVAPASVPESPSLVLKATVTERTWMRVIIDDGKPKEYIFSPESTPEWRAQKGFELLIGNAGGVNLEFNGRKMDNLGKQGQVIRLKLPSNTERIISSE